MGSPKRTHGTCDLAEEVEHWIAQEEGNRELKDRIASALDEIKGFIGERQSDLEKRKGKLLQSSGFKDETRAMEAALANIQQLFVSGRNVSRIFSEIDKYLNTFNIGDTLSRLHTRIELADARDEYMGMFHDSIRGTKLSELLDILYFMPFAFWRSRGLERRNYRSPAAAEILKLLGELGRLRVDINGIDIVLLAAIIRIRLGITPRMDYHHMSSNKLAEQLTAGETLTRFTTQAMPLDEGFCRAAGGILANLRRWSAEFFGSAGLPAPAEIEAEMLQIVFLAADTIRISGAESERSTDYLWLLSTVIASDHATLKDVLSWPPAKNTRYASVYERILVTKTYLDTIAVLADGILAARWSEAKDELNSLTGRSEVIASKGTHEYGEFMELEQLKEKRSDVGKSLIKISDSLRLIEPALLDVLTTPGDLSGLPEVDEHVRTLDPAALMDRNRSNAEETKLIARRELEKLRVLIGRIATISRKGFAASTTQEELERLRALEKPARKTSDGVEIGKIPAADLRKKLLGSLQKAVLSVREFKSKVEGARKRTLKSDLLHALNVLHEKIRRAADNCDKTDADTVDDALAPAAAETIAPLLREIMTAHTNFSARLNNVKLTPAEKQPFTTMLYAMKTRLNDDLRDIECLRAELAERCAEAKKGPCGDAAREEACAPAVHAQETAMAVSAVKKAAGLAAAANNALKPVKAMMTCLSTKISERKRDHQAILAAARDLKNGISEARELLAVNFALIETIAPTFTTTNDEYVDKFDRWRLQLAAVDEETGRLLQATESITEIEAAVRTAAALAEGIADGEDLLSRCGRCAHALEALTRSFSQLREARETCATAARAEWRLLKGASAYLEKSGSYLDACQADLIKSQSWVEELQTILCS